ncbi:carbohydrate kinase [bacterium]|nr:carbohydrate kinase [bacterium]
MRIQERKRVDVLCVGIGCWDLVFGVDHHFGPDEKGFASSCVRCGGGVASNAAVAVARLGYRAAYAGYLGCDQYGEEHLQELIHEGVYTDWVSRGEWPTSLAVLLVKPDGSRTVVNYRSNYRYLQEGSIDFRTCEPKVILFDGHEPDVSSPLAHYAREHGIPTILDAGSLHAGTETLMNKVDYLIVSEKFAHHFISETDEKKAIEKLYQDHAAVVITLGERGLIWKRNGTKGHLPAFQVHCVDSTGAGDAFHGAFAAGLVGGMGWENLLRYASAVGALCCTRLGGRPGIPTHEAVEQFLSQA